MYCIFHLLETFRAVIVLQGAEEAAMHPFLSLKQFPIPFSLSLPNIIHFGPLKITAQSFIANLRWHSVVVCKARRESLGYFLCWLKITYSMDDHVLNREIRYGDGPEGVPEAFSTLQTVPLEDPYNRQDPEAFSTLQTVPLEDPYNRQDPQVVEFAEGKEVYVREYVQDPQVVEFAEGKEVYVREHIQVVEFAEGKEVHVRGHVQGRQIHKLVKPEINFSLLKRFRKQICVAVAALGSILVIAVVGAVVEVKDHRSVANAPSTPYVRSTNIAVSSSKIFTSSINVSIPSPSSSISSVNASTAPSNSFTSDTNISIPSSDAYNGTGLSVTHSLLSSPQVVLFYQHSAGSIRASRLVNDVWQPYDQTQDLIVPSGARSGTPIGSVSYYIGSCCDTEVVSSAYNT